MDRGASFCQVNRIRPELRVVPCVTSGSHVWKGARPSFIISAVKVIMIMSLLVWG